MASAKVPAFIVWNESKATIPATLQQSDLLTSIINAKSGEACFGDVQGSFLPIENPTSARCAVHRRGDDRTLTSLRCDNENVEVILDGDETRVKEGKTSPIAVDIVNYFKLRQTVLEP